ncbi:Uu.00g016740.m01.CDS01 [Anthostomella pinea]|uniref:Uu.00g016740.m01.CDS01 n=1 Tax=Anthostomella pinea TaxID=933095 RepID=A0AAI8VZC1_9PEZI|nr:Uu.00g016740.m01.CDS01 [Anthostomella pinea]
MWLINCSTLQLEEHYGREIPPYAILSHTWDDEEVTFRDFVDRRDERTRMKGWQKIQRTCSLAIEDGLEYAWVDTCCIDKSSSAELTVAINSMFKWYSEATVCHAYLEDLEDPRPESFAACRWFRRGWTLQELIAPRHVRFYNNNWQLHGTKSGLGEEISDITGIALDILEIFPGRSLRSVLREQLSCRKMSWAARRETKREEDVAYCLLGIFEVNMPLLYGEGDQKAFTRLQKEIIKNTNDLTLFAWPDNQMNPPLSGILAQSPLQFIGARFFECYADLVYVPEFQMTNKGLRLHMPLHKLYDGTKLALIKLGCLDAAGTYVLELLHLGGGVYCRVSLQRWNPTRHYQDLSGETPTTMYIVQSVPHGFQPNHKIDNNRGMGSFYIEICASLRCERAEPASHWVDRARTRFKTHDAPTFAGFCIFEVEGQEESLVVACGYSHKQKSWVCVATAQSSPSLWAAALKCDLELVGVLGHYAQANHVSFGEDNGRSVFVSLYVDRDQSGTTSTADIKLIEPK